MIGKTLGHYQILEPLGAGGMGEVYRARDTRLDRDVAIKVLPVELATDPERLARLEREARVLAQLEHPNIAAIYGLEEATPAGADEPIRFLVMQLAEGETLADRIARGPIPVEEALAIGLQIAEGLEAAHDKGIVHRDLKPANVKVAEDAGGNPQVKILDFGLAKAYESGGTASAISPDLSGSPTVVGSTRAGVILGTAAYMSPEQARGRPLDRRSDVWAFGCVLYEMLTSRRAFAGEDVSDTLAAVLRDDPDWESIPRATPASVRALLRRCLTRDVRERLQAIGEARYVLREAAADAGLGGPSREPGTRRRPIARPRWIAAAVALVLAALLAYGLFFSGTVVAIADSVAVMPFENLADPADATQLGGMMTDLVRGHLSQSDELTVVSGYRLYDIHRQLSDETVTFDLSLAGEVARRAGAEAMVLGRIRVVGNETFVVAELVDVATGRVLASPQSAGAGEQDVFTMSQGLAAELRAQLLPADADVVVTPAAGGGTDDIEALRAFNRGEALLRNGDLQGAIGQFETAVRIDPDFHRPWYQLALLGLWTDVEESVQRRAADRLTALIDRFPLDERAAVNGLLLYSAGDLSGSVPVYEQYLKDHPDDKFALYVLAEVYAHSARDYDLVLSAQMFERILELDPSFSLAFIDVPYNYGFAGDLPRAYEFVARWEGRHPALAQEAIAVLGALEGDLDRGLEQMADLDTPLSLMLEPAVALLAGRWQLVEDLLDALEGSARNWWRAWTLRDRADLHVYRGELTAAAAAYDEAGRALDYAPHEGIVQGGHPASSLRALAQLRALRGDLPGAREAAELALAIQPESPRRLYFAGLFALRAGDEATAAARLDTINALLPEIRSHAGWIYRDALQAELHLAGGDPGAAIALLETVLASDVLLEDFFVDWSTGALMFRDTLARAHVAVGDTQRAVAALEAMVQATFERMNHPVPETLAYYKLGVLHQELGNQQETGRYLQAFLDRWGTADWDLDEVADARRRLAELQARAPEADRGGR